MEDKKSLYIFDWGIGPLMARGVFRAVPCRPACLGSGLGTALCIEPCRARAGPKCHASS
jgi:hypothetical protein